MEIYLDNEAISGITSVLNSFDEKIVQSAYKMYDLTKEEIKIMEIQ
jgi:hypothetical protein